MMKNVEKGLSVLPEQIADNPYAYVSTRARVAIYDDFLSAPRIVDIQAAPVLDFIENIASTTYDHSKKQGGDLPYTVIREIAENFIHANFKECTVSILNNGNTIHFSDQGPGIEKKRLVLEPGVSSAVSEMKNYIRGVGSGFPIVREYLALRSGHLSIDDNANGGVIITLAVGPKDELEGKVSDSASFSQTLERYPNTTFSSTEDHNRAVFNVNDHTYSTSYDAGTSAQRSPVRSLLEHAPQGSQDTNNSFALDKRSERVLVLLYENGIMGPSDLMEPLAISAATAHRILVELERRGLIEHTPNRKRILSSAGVAYYEGKLEH